YGKRVASTGNSSSCRRRDAPGVQLFAGVAVEFYQGARTRTAGSRPLRRSRPRGQARRAAPFPFPGWSAWLLALSLSTTCLTLFAVGHWSGRLRAWQPPSRRITVQVFTSEG